MLYARPVFSRGQGFGNRLFPWARARVFAGAHGATMVAPWWPRLAVGPLRRGGVSLRAYREQFLLVGLFRAGEGEVRGLARLLVERGAVVRPEPDDLAAPLDPPPDPARRTVVRFEGWRRYFEPLLGRHASLHAALRAIARPSILERVDRLPEVPIAMNVRAGNDFPDAAPGARRIGPGEKTPVLWFRDLLRLVRDAAGRAAPAFVVSDGTAEGLAPLLAEPEVRLVRPGGALSDLLTLARARVLLASGSSSFSAWGAFLGDMPAASHPGQPLAAFRLPDGAPGSPPRREVDAASPDPAFLAAAAAALRR